jgi:hypothetical protein
MPRAIVSADKILLYKASDSRCGGSRYYAPLILSEQVIPQYNKVAFFYRYLYIDYIKTADLEDVGVLY